MVKFIVCDDNSALVSKINRIISKIMMPVESEYKILEFNRYDSKFKEAMNEKDGSKIYILDIEVENISGLDIARKIREKDWNSIIIFVSVYYELSYQAFRNRLLILDFLSKFDNLDQKLSDTITLALEIMELKSNISFLSNDVMHNIDANDILYITRDEKKRKTALHTYSKTFYINITLSDFEKKLNSNFIKTHRACIVNKKNIKTINYKENKIILKNEESIYLLSRARKKEVKELCKM